MREFYGFGLYLASMIILVLYISYLPNPLLISLPIWTVSLIPFVLILNTSYALIINTSTSVCIDATKSLSIQNIDKILDPESIPDLEDVPLSIVNECFKV